MRESGEWLDATSVAAMLRTLFAGATDAIGLSSQATIRVANPALVSLFGYDDESELVGRSVLDLIDPAAQPMITEFARRRSMGEEVPPIYETRGLRKDGSTFAMRVQTTTFLFRAEVWSLTVLREVSEAPRSAAPTFASEELYRALFDVNTAVKLLIAPDTGQILDANQAAVTLYGWSKAELKQRRITDINTLTPDEVKAEMDNARTGKRRYFRFRHRTASGDVRSVEVHSGPVEIDGRTLLLSIIHDVTERDLLEQQLRLAQRLEAVGRLAGGIAHDFNNLLAVMNTVSEAIGRELPEGSKALGHVEDLRYVAERAAELTRNLLAFSSAKPVLRASLSLNDVVVELGKLLSRSLGPKIAVTTVLDPSLPPVLADRSQLEQVVMNLSINARDAMPDGGTVTLTTARRTVQEPDASPVPIGKWVTLSVSDTGHGIDEETLVHVFEPFFTTKSSGTGSGLGLSIVHGIVTQSGGYVTVDSEHGAGTCFTIYLPRAP